MSCPVQTSQLASFRFALCAALLVLLGDGTGRADAKVQAADNRVSAILDSVPSEYYSYREETPAAIQKALASLRNLSDAELRDAMADARGPRLEFLVTEAIRRGGKEWGRSIVDRWRVEPHTGSDAKDESTAENISHEERVNHPSVEWLTTVRRLEGKPDPLQILVIGKRKIRCSLGEFPRLFVALANLDTDHAEVQYTEGGDYRSGRQARFRLELTDSEGKALPERGHHEILVIGGGLFVHGTLQYGESWATELAMSSFVRFDAPGEYTLRVLYHDHVTIADCNDATGLITCCSLPIQLTVDPIEVEATSAELEAIASAIAELPKEGTVKFIDGEYRKEAHDFIAPDSPAGKLLTWKWKAVPAMIDAATDETTSPVQRAWLLALLASITGAHDPRDESGVLGSCTCSETGWNVWGGTPGQMSGGIGFGRTYSVSGSPVDPDRQLEFANRWKAWKEKEYVKLTTAGGEAPGGVDEL